MRIGIICAVERELLPYLQNFDFETKEVKAKLHFHIGKYSNKEIVAVYSGVCKVNAAIATQILIDTYKVDIVVVSGVAGALDKKFKIFDTVISNEVAYHDVARGILTEYHPWMESIYFKADAHLLESCKSLIEEGRFFNRVCFGKIVTGEKFITDEGRNEIIESFSPQCVDMETAAVAHVCYVFDTPYVAIRTMSDDENQRGEEVFDSNCKRAAHYSFLVVKELIKYI